MHEQHGLGDHLTKLLIKDDSFKGDAVIVASANIVLGHLPDILDPLEL